MQKLRFHNRDWTRAGVLKEEPESLFLRLAIPVLIRSPPCAKKDFFLQGVVGVGAVMMTIREKKITLRLSLHNSFHRRQWSLHIKKLPRE